MQKNNYEEKTYEQYEAEFKAAREAFEYAKALKEKKEKEEAERKKVELKKQKEARRQAIDKKTEELAELIEEFVKDYGYYSSTKTNNINELFSFWLRHF